MFGNDRRETSLRKWSWPKRVVGPMDLYRRLSCRRLASYCINARFDNIHLGDIIQITNSQIRSIPGRVNLFGPRLLSQRVKQNLPGKNTKLPVEHGR